MLSSSVGTRSSQYAGHPLGERDASSCTWGGGLYCPRIIKGGHDMVRNTLQREVGLDQGTPDRTGPGRAGPCRGDSYTGTRRLTARHGASREKLLCEINLICG